MSGLDKPTATAKNSTASTATSSKRHHGNDDFSLPWQNQLPYMASPIHGFVWQYCIWKGGTGWSWILGYSLYSPFSTSRPEFYKAKQLTPFFAKAGAFFLGLKLWIKSTPWQRLGPLDIHQTGWAEANVGIAHLTSSAILNQAMGQFCKAACLLFDCFQQQFSTPFVTQQGIGLSDTLEALLQSHPMPLTNGKRGR